MNPVKLDLNVYKGSTYKKAFQWLTYPDQLPMDLTGCSIAMQIRACTDSPDIIFEATTANLKIEITNATEGRWQLTIPASESALWLFSKAVYDLDISFLSGEVYTVIQGIVTTKAEVTRNA